MLALFHQSMCLPKSHIGIVAPANNVLVIQCVVDSEYSLHTFCMINVSGGALICFKDANSVIIGSRDKLLTCQRPTLMAPWCPL